MPKPRKFAGDGARGECVVNDDGDRIIDASIDIYDDIASVDRVVSFSKWLAKAAKWLKEEEAAKK